MLEKILGRIRRGRFDEKYASGIITDLIIDMRNPYQIIEQLDSAGDDGLDIDLIFSGYSSEGGVAEDLEKRIEILTNDGIIKREGEKLYISPVGKNLFALYSKFKLIEDIMSESSSPLSFGEIVEKTGFKKDDLKSYLDTCVKSGYLEEDKWVYFLSERTLFGRKG